jgi:YD repeat-containing protein
LDSIYVADELVRGDAFQARTSRDDWFGERIMKSWDFDALGNWDGVTTNGTTQTRSHNRQNEITGVSGATTPTFDAAGNMTTDETGKQYVYDAWNRLVVVKDAGGAELVRYEYDGLTRRIQEHRGSTNELHYSDQWQVIWRKSAGNVLMVGEVYYLDGLPGTEMTWKEGAV